MEYELYWDENPNDMVISGSFSNLNDARRYCYSAVVRKKKSIGVLKVTVDGYFGFIGKVEMANKKRIWKSKNGKYILNPDGSLGQKYKISAKGYKKMK